MTGTVLVVVELRGSAPTRSSLEALSLGRSIAGAPPSGTLVAAVLGSAPEAAAAQVAQRGVDRVLAVADPGLDTFHGALWAGTISVLAQETGAAWVVLGGTNLGRQLAGRVAARWKAAAVTGVTGLTSSADGSTTVVRPLYSGRAVQEVRIGAPRAVLAARPNAFPTADPAGATAPVETRALPALGPMPSLGARDGFEAADSGSGPDLSEATVVVSGGRGLKGPENFRLLEELAGALGAAVGASRAVTDSGWKPATLQIGQTGRTVSPQLYIAVGISGAIQHLVGMISSRTIVAINSDPNAPIFKVADYGVVGDLFQIVPALTAEVRRLRGG